MAFNLTWAFKNFKTEDGFLQILKYPQDSRQKAFLLVKICPDFLISQWLCVIVTFLSTQARMCSVHLAIVLELGAFAVQNQEFKSNKGWSSKSGRKKPRNGWEEVTDTDPRLGKGSARKERKAGSLWG